MLIERIALIAPATVTADRVLASTVQTHARKLDAFIDILTLCETFSPRAQLCVGLCAHFGTQLAPIATPGSADGTTAEAFREMAFYGTGALAMTIVQETSFLPGVDAGGVCNREIREEIIRMRRNIENNKKIYECYYNFLYILS